MNYCPTEEEEQAAVFRWAELMSGQHPELQLLMHIPNGGYRHPATAARMKAQGVKAGVPDIFLPVPRDGFHGLWIEMKRVKGGKVSPEQKEWIEILNSYGYFAIVCRGADEAIHALEVYFGI